MRHRILIKLLVIALLIVGLTIPNLMIRDLVGERSHYRHEARQGIAASWTGAQKFLGPILVVPYTERHERKVWDDKQNQFRVVEQVDNRRLFVLPDDLDIAADIRSEERRRGIYSIPVYDSTIDVQGGFDNRRILALADNPAVTIDWPSAFVSVPVSDIRGIGVQPELSWNDVGIEFVSGSGIGPDGNGMRAIVPGIRVSQAVRFAFRFSVRLRGMETLEFSPVGKNTRVTIRSAWPHPSFLGRYLPVERDIDDGGFSAVWRVTSFSSDMGRVSALCEQNNCDAFFGNTFGVALIQPVDIYRQTERSVKYAVLIITLTFVAFFLFEVMRSIQLHPVQYLLVGCSLSVFYLLLLSLSEHVAFGWAYLIAAIANTSLIGVYIRTVLRSRSRAGLLSGALLVLYGMLYLILRSEDNALLMGSLLIFTVLASVMLLTRDLDWYRVSEQVGSRRAATGQPAGS